MTPPRWHAVLAAVGTTTAAVALFVTAGLAAGSTGATAPSSASPATVPAAAGDRFVGPSVPTPATAGPTVPTDAAGSTSVAPNGADLVEISTDTDHGLPTAARAAYRAAARTVNREKRGCQLPWELIAGIGRVETDHGRYGGSKLGTDGVSRPLIRGIALDGVGPVAAIPDTDGGRLDGDRVWDRAVGPMQFIPSTWQFAGRDGDGDGRRDPDDLDDAALAAAGYLCPASGTILDLPVMRAQVFSYNHSDYYVDLVIAFAIGYHTGVFDLPPPPTEPTDEPTQAPTDEPTTDPRTRTTTPPTREPQPTRQPEPEPTREPQPTAQPTRTPSPTPTPTPTTPPAPPPPTYTTGTGAWSSCGSTWCVAGVALDLGPGSRYDVTAAADFDGDGTVETNRAELDGLVGRSVTVQVKRRTTEVYLINGAGYRNADGSFAT